MPEPDRASSFLDALRRSSWHRQAACADTDVNFFPEPNHETRNPGAGAVLLPLLYCARCPVRRSCLEESLGTWPAPRHDDDGRTVSQTRARGVWGGATEPERAAVADLPVEQAIEELEAGFGTRMAERVALFRAKKNPGQYGAKVRAMLAEMKRKKGDQR